MLVENPVPGQIRGRESCFCAIRKRKADGSPNVGRDWLEPMGSVTQFVEDQKTYEVVFYGPGDQLPP